MIFDLQKASMLKRISAFLFDFIMRVMLITGIAIIFSAAFGYDAKVDKLDGIYDKYELEYGVDLQISGEEYSALTEEQAEKYEAAAAAFNKDPEVSRLTALILNLTLLISVFSILSAYLVLEFAVPLFLKNGQTLGKKIFGIGVIRDDGVRITPVMLFVRSILGKCTVEAFVPLAIIMLFLLGNAGIFGLLSLLLLLGLEVFLVVRTKTNSCIHDVLSYSAVVDMASQMIFDNEEALIEYKNRIHREAVDKSDY